MAKYYSTDHASGYMVSGISLETLLSFPLYEVAQPVRALEDDLKLLGLVEGEIADAMSQMQSSKEWWNAPCASAPEKFGPGYHVVLRSGKVITIFVGTPHPPMLCGLNCFIQNMR